MALGLTQPLTERSTRNLPEGKNRSARKAGNLAAVSRMSDLTLRVCTVCTGKTLPL
jgi:hypothetical protein